MTVFEFLASRKIGTNQYYSHPAATRTILISSHIWWTELIAFAFLRSGFNILVTEPWYGFYMDDTRFAHFDEVWNQWVAQIRESKIDLIVGGNTTAMVMHPRTGELLHRAAGVPIVHYWWDEMRSPPPMSRRGIPIDSFLNCLRDERTLNAIWDIDVVEEMRDYFNITNSFHLPLGTTVDFWPVTFQPLEKRPWKACFLGNCHFEPAASRAKWDPTIESWSSAVAKQKLPHPDRPMVQCVSDAVGAYVPESTLDREFSRWGQLGVLLMETNRNAIVGALARRLGEQLVLIGKGWENLGLKAMKDHSGVPKAAEYYANSIVSLNLFGGCVHAGMPLRPYETAASHGLIFTQFNRELPDLFEPERECIAFRDAEEMLGKLEPILAEPARYNDVVRLGRERVIAQHTWEHRVRALVEQVRTRLAPGW